MEKEISCPLIVTLTMIGFCRSTCIKKQVLISSAQADEFPQEKYKNLGLMNPVSYTTVDLQCFPFISIHSASCFIGYPVTMIYVHLNLFTSLVSKENICARIHWTLAKQSTVFIKVPRVIFSYFFFIFFGQPFGKLCIKILYMFWHNCR